MIGVYFWKKQGTIQVTRLNQVPEDEPNFMTLYDAVCSADFLNLTPRRYGIYDGWRQLALDVIRLNPGRAKKIDPNIHEKLRYGSWSYKRKQDIRARLGRSQFPGSDLGITRWNLQPASKGVAWNFEGSYPYFQYRSRVSPVGYVTYASLGFTSKPSLEDALKAGLLVMARKQYQSQAPLRPLLVIEKAIADALPDPQLRHRLETFFRLTEMKPIQLMANDWRHEPVNNYYPKLRSQGRAIATASIHSDLVEALFVIDGEGLTNELLGYPWEIDGSSTFKPWFVSMAEAIKHGLIEELTQQSMSRLRTLTD